MKNVRAVSINENQIAIFGGDSNIVVYDTTKRFDCFKTVLNDNANIKFFTYRNKAVRIATNCVAMFALENNKEETFVKIKFD